MSDWGASMLAAFLVMLAGAAVFTLMLSLIELGVHPIFIVVIIIIFVLLTLFFEWVD